MSVKKSLSLGRIQLSARTITSLSLCGDRLVIYAMGKFYVLQGSNLHHCAIDLVCGQCKRIKVVAASPLEPLQWQVHRITPASRLPTTTGVTAPFHAIVPKGWLLFETTPAWHFWPIEDLLAIALTSTRLLFVYDKATLEVMATTAILRDEFDRWAERVVVARHYTARGADAFQKIAPVDRFYASEVCCRFCDPIKGLKGQPIKEWLPLSDKLPEPPRQKRWEIER